MKNENTTQETAHTGAVLSCETEERLPEIPVGAEQLIAQAIDKNLPVETMERLLAMRRELKAEAAKEAFDMDMSKLQGELPIIVKDKTVDFTSKRTGSRTKYSYAPIDSIVRQTREVIAKYGFSYAVTTEQTPADMTAICTVRHEMGHSESTAFRVPLDPDAFMSGPQKVGAAMTFAKRYAFCNAFGIITGDEDSDANTVDSVSDSKPLQNVTPSSATQQTALASEKQLQMIAIKRQQYGMSEDAFRRAYNILTTKQLTARQATDAIARLDKYIAEGKHYEDPNVPIVNTEPEEITMVEVNEALDEADKEVKEAPEKARELIEDGSVPSAKTPAERMMEGGYTPAGRLKT